MIEAAMNSDDPSQWPAIEPDPEPEPGEPHIAALVPTQAIAARKPSKEEEPPLISKIHILEAVRANPLQLWQIAHTLSTAADSQNVVTCEDLFYNETLREELRKLGYHQDALALEIFGKAHMAWDAPGFSQEERTAMLMDLKELLKVLLAHRMHSIKGLTSGNRVGGWVS
ncbi:hypothetical protein CYMTET_26809 [Cymbomonas tetramitiformis]|uniref:Uncharacterized protein n=1 Tax=Cymbomonas tetramitiformis TaxID=36881 RepID=A0AAE0KXV9_9CHLO|nr:hypothetical protein CYMTET_26809 [Cymbomonas tetramitiformis]